MDNYYNPAPTIIILILSFITGMVIGSEISAPGQIRDGRNQGIIFCSEKPEQCKIEYQYLKLKKNQK